MQDLASPALGTPFDTSLDRLLLRDAGRPFLVRTGSVLALLRLRLPSPDTGSNREEMDSGCLGGSRGLHQMDFPADCRGHTRRVHPGIPRQGAVDPEDLAGSGLWPRLRADAARPRPLRHWSQRVPERPAPTRAPRQPNGAESQQADARRSGQTGPRSPCGRRPHQPVRKPTETGEPGAFFMGAGALLVLYPTRAYDYSMPSLLGFIPAALLWASKPPFHKALARPSWLPPPPSSSSLDSSARRATPACPRSGSTFSSRWRLFHCRVY